MTKEEILDYVMNSPENTNRMVLSDMLNQLSSSNTSGLIVTITYNSNDGTYTIDKTPEEIFAAYDNFLPVRAYVDYGEYHSATLSLTQAEKYINEDNPDTYHFQFFVMGPMEFDSKLFYEVCTINGTSDNLEIDYTPYVWDVTIP